MFADKFGNLITAMATPFSGDGLKVDFSGLERLVEHLIQTGSTALLIAGTTGENPTLAYQEEQEIIKFTIKQVANRIPVIVGIGSNCTQSAVNAAAFAESVGADSVMAVSPYYNKPNQDGLIEHFGVIARSTSLPIMLYNNPGRTASYIDVKTICHLAENHSNISALKESGSPYALDTVTQLQIMKAPIDVYGGDDSLLLPFLSVGCQGIVSVASHVIGEQMVELLQTYKDKQDIISSVEQYNSLYPLFSALFHSPSPGPVKYLLNYLGICNLALRLPLTPPDGALRSQLENIFLGITGSKCGTMN